MKSAVRYSFAHDAVIHTIYQLKYSEAIDLPDLEYVGIQIVLV